MARRKYPPAVVGPGGGVGQRPPKPKLPPAVVGIGGGVGPKSPKPGTVGGLTQPPFLTYDPATEAARRAAQRGFHDTLQDVNKKRHFGEKDLAQALRDIRTENSRKRGDLNTEARRGNRKLDWQEQDTQLKATRTSQDFTTQLATIGRQFAQLGHRQGEAANSAGVLDAGTQAASQAARSQNQQIAEAPIHTAQGRLSEDLATALGRIGVGRGELNADRSKALGRLTVDRERDRRLTKQTAARNKFDQYLIEQRARRELPISEADLIAKEIYEARQNRPGAFGKTGQRKKKGR